MNIYDIAKEAGVSISTVSRVLNKKSNVREDTKQRVEAVLEKHSYRPSAIARGLVSSSMRTVAVLTVDIRVPLHAYSGSAHCGYPGTSPCKDSIYNRAGVQPQRI